MLRILSECGVSLPCEAGLRWIWSAGEADLWLSLRPFFLHHSSIRSVAAERGCKRCGKQENCRSIYSLSVWRRTRTLIIGGICGREDCKERERERKFPTFDAWPSCSDKILKQFFDSQLSHRSSDILLQDKSHTHIHTPHCYTSPRPFPSITLPLSHSYALSSSTYYPCCSLFLHTHGLDWAGGLTTY